MSYKTPMAIVLGIIVLMMSTLLAPIHSQGAVELIPIYTPPAGGVVYMLGTGIASINNKNMQDAKFVHEATTGTMEIVRRMMQKESQKKPVFALFASPDSPRALKGEGEYKGKPFSNLRAVAFVNSSDIYFVVSAKSGIKTFADAKGKRIGIGGAGSTNSTAALYFLEMHGVKKDDFKPAYFNYKEVVEGIQNGSLDGGFLGGSYPMPTYQELSLQHDVRIVPVDENVIKKAVAEHPVYYRSVIKANSYKGLEKDTTIYGFGTYIWTYAGVSDDLVYKFLKSVYEHRNDLYAIHKAIQKDFVVENMARPIPVPFHPAAAKYLKEIGAMK